MMLGRQAILYPSDGVLAAVLFNQPTKVFRILLLNYRSCYTKDELYQFTFAIFLLAASLFIKELIVLPFFIRLPIGKIWIFFSGLDLYFYIMFFVKELETKAEIR